MIRIKCVNAACAKKSFDWDESRHGHIARPHAPRAKRVIAVCPYCTAENAVWVTRVKRLHKVMRY